MRRIGTKGDGEGTGNGQGSEGRTRVWYLVSLPVSHFGGPCSISGFSRSGEGSATTSSRTKSHRDNKMKRNERERPVQQHTCDFLCQSPNPRGRLSARAFRLSSLMYLVWVVIRRAM